MRDICQNIHKVKDINKYNKFDLKINLSHREQILLENAKIFFNSKSFIVENDINANSFSQTINPMIFLEIQELISINKFNFFQNENSNLLNKTIFFCCFYDSNNYLKEISIESTFFKDKSQINKKFFIDNLIFSSAISIDAKNILLEKFSEITKLAKKEKKESIIINISKSFRYVCKKLNQIKSFYLQKYEEIILQEKSDQYILFLIKDIFDKLKMNFYHIVRIYFRMIRHVKNSDQIIIFFWQIIASISDLGSMNIIIAPNEFLNVLFSDKHLIPYFVSQLEENFSPLLKYSFFPYFFKFLLFCEKNDHKIFHSECYIKLCRLVCNDYDNFFKISNSEQFNINFDEIFSTFSTDEIKVLPFVLIQIIKLDIPIIFPLLTIMVGLNDSEDKLISNFYKPFLLKFCEILLNKKIISSMVYISKSISSLTTQQVKVIISFLYKLMNLVSLQLNPFIKLVFIFIISILKSVTESPQNKKMKSIFMSDAYIRDSWEKTFKETQLPIDDREDYIYLEHEYCRKFLNKHLDKEFKNNLIKKKHFSLNKESLINSLKLSKQTPIDYNIFKNIKVQIRNPEKTVYWNKNRSFLFEHHFSDILKSIALFNIQIQQNLFLKTVFLREAKHFNKKIKKNIFLKGLLRVPFNDEILYLFSNSLRVTGSFDLRSTRLKLVKAKHLKNVSQHFENNTINNQTKKDISKKNLSKNINTIIENKNQNEMIFDVAEFLKEKYNKEFFQSDESMKSRVELLKSLVNVPKEDKIVEFINAGLTKEFNTVVHGFLIITVSKLVFIPRIQLCEKSKKFILVKPSKSREYPYKKYFTNEFSQDSSFKTILNEKELQIPKFKVFAKIIPFEKMKEIHEKPYMLKKCGIDIFMENGRTFNFIIPKDLHIQFFEKLFESIYLSLKLKKKELRNGLEKIYRKSYEYYFLIIQNICHCKSIELFSRTELIKRLFENIQLKKNDNYSILAFINLLAGKSIVLNNNSFIYPFLFEFKEKKFSKFSIKNFCNVSEMNESYSFCSDSNKLCLLNKNHKSYNSIRFNNKRKVPEYIGFNFKDFGDCFQFLYYRIVKKLDQDPQNFENHFYFFDRTNLSLEQKEDICKFWRIFISDSKLEKSHLIKKLKDFPLLMKNDKIKRLLESMVILLKDPLCCKNYLIYNTDFHFNLFSNAHFLMRMHPFTEYHLQTKHDFDFASRTFRSFQEQQEWLVSNSLTEEMPVFIYSSPEIFFNSNFLTHENFSNFQMPEKFKRFYQSFVDYLYKMLSEVKVQELLVWAALIFDNHHRNFKHFNSFWNCFYEDVLEKKSKKSKILNKLNDPEDCLFKGNQGSLCLGILKIQKDMNIEIEKFSSIRKNSYKNYKTKTFSLPFFTKGKLKEQKKNSMHSEKISPSIASSLEDSFSSNSTETDTSDKFNIKYCFKKFFNSCGPMKKFLGHQLILEQFSLSEYDQFLVREDVNLIFDISDSILITQDQNKKEFLWIEVPTGQVTSCEFFDFDESIFILGNNIGQLSFFQITKRDSLSNEGKTLNQYILKTEFIDSKYLKLIEKYINFQNKDFKYKFFKNALKELLIYENWRINCSNYAITFIKRNNNSKNVLVGDSKGSIFEINFFLKTFIRKFDSPSIKKKCLIKYIFYNDKIVLSKKTKSPLLYSQSEILKSNNTSFHISENNMSKLNEMSTSKHCLLVNKKTIETEPVNFIDFSSDDKILSVSDKSFSLFSPNGVLLGVHFSNEKENFKKGYFIRDSTFQPETHVLIFTSKSELILFEIIQNEFDEDKKIISNNYNYFLNQSNFFPFHLLEKSFKVKKNRNSFHIDENFNEICIKDVFCLNFEKIIIFFKKDSNICIKKTMLEI